MSEVSSNPEYPLSRTLPGMMARLRDEDWSSMTARANASPNHVSSDERWTRKAREANASLDEDQAYRLGQLLKKQHYVRMGNLSAASRRIKRRIAELDAEEDEISTPPSDDIAPPENEEPEAAPDLELRAMARIVAAMEPLDLRTRRRVRTWFDERWADG